MCHNKFSSRLSGFIQYHLVVAQKLIPRPLIQADGPLVGLGNLQAEAAGGGVVLLQPGHHRGSQSPAPELRLEVYLLQKDTLAPHLGYLYVTQCYSAEVGGRCVFLEEIFLKEEYRRRGLGAQVMAWLEGEYPAARRFRLEVTQANQGAISLYQRAGYTFLRYDQMVLDKIK